MTKKHKKDNKCEVIKNYNYLEEKTIYELQKLLNLEAEKAEKILNNINLGAWKLLKKSNNIIILLFSVLSGLYAFLVPIQISILLFLANIFTCVLTIQEFKLNFLNNKRNFCRLSKKINDEFSKLEESEELIKNIDCILTSKILDRVLSNDFTENSEYQKEEDEYSIIDTTGSIVSSSISPIVDENNEENGYQKTKTF